jgi:cyclopropane fatty-acyl-phospholipid synthase-like methyltransferase
MEEFGKQLEAIEQELFCTRFELKALSDAFFYQKNERWVKGFSPAFTESHHLVRYELAAKYVKNKSVLDIACGSGFGSFILATNGEAKSVHGVDIDPEAIRYGSIRYKHERIARSVGDVTRFSTNAPFDLIVSFETIEHITAYDAMIKALHSVLKENGILIVSTPINERTTTVLTNPFHVIEWSFVDFHELFKGLFVIDEVFLQNVILKRKVRKKPGAIRKTLSRVKKYLKNQILKPEPFSSKSTKHIVEIEQFTGQYDSNDIVGGYQVLILRKK